MTKRSKKKVATVGHSGQTRSDGTHANHGHPPTRGGMGLGPRTEPQKRRRKNSRAKGAVGERELARVLVEAGFIGSKRGQQRSGLEQADVIGIEGWHIECKRVEALNVWAAYAQAERDAKDGDHPMVAMRRNHGKWLAVLDLKLLLKFIMRAQLDRQFLGPLAEDLDFLTAWEES